MRSLSNDSLKVPPRLPIISSSTGIRGFLLIVLQNCLKYYEFLLVNLNTDVYYDQLKEKVTLGGALLSPSFSPGLIVNRLRWFCESNSPPLPASCRPRFIEDWQEIRKDGWMMDGQKAEMFKISSDVVNLRQTCAAYFANRLRNLS